MRKKKRKTGEAPQEDPVLTFMRERQRREDEAASRDGSKRKQEKELRRLERGGRTAGAVPSSPTEEERTLFGLGGGGTLPPGW